MQWLSGSVNETTRCAISISLTCCSRYVFRRAASLRASSRRAGLSCLAGALSTLSTFSYQTLRLAEEGLRIFALAYVLATVAAGLAAAEAGVTLAHAAWALPREPYPHHFLVTD
jgi:fluoride ion exporter CrcB/FEX